MRQIELAFKYTKKRLLRILVDLDYNRCYGAPVQACSLTPSKLQTRSMEQVPTPRNSHSMRFSVTAIIKSARFFVIFFYLVSFNLPLQAFLMVLKPSYFLFLKGNYDGNEPRNDEASSLVIN